MAASDGTEYYEVDMEMGGDRFTRPSNAERDEDELLWAALERLPSEKRTNFALLRRELSKAQGKDIRTVDVRKLDRFNRELVVKNALATTDQDNYRLLAGIKKRLDRAGIKVPNVEVRFEDVTISAKVKLGSRALPTLVNYVRDLSEKVFTSLGIIHPERHPLTILNDVSGIITPGRGAEQLQVPVCSHSSIFFLVDILFWNI
ncbi:ABC transporter G family member 31 [Heracleum sosnowskyi]|uniref:ABC transporter G family member 31 n=1 Tax=Heracleum sosnowskyi TaxID=360622 RepID=A0AAD8MK53_9APIA|nr:ABC transporter G family member 31 [Heracleum sosnowskyi]